MDIRHRKKMKMTRESAVSETIGFIIIFGIVMTGIGIVTLYGYPALMQEQENTNVRNMQKNMLVLQSDLKSLTFKNVPYQETAIQVSGGTLSILDEPNPTPYFTINVSGPSALSIIHGPGELKYIAGNGEANIALENGAVHIRYWNDLTGSAMLASPPWFYDATTKTYVIHLIKLNASSHFGQTGIGLVRMEMIEPPQQIERNITGENVTISYKANITEDYMVAWRNYFENPDLKMTYLGTPEPREIMYGLDPSAEHLVIKRYNVTVLSL